MRPATGSGAQAERTTLAWVRTCLAYLACSLLAARLAARFAPLLGGLALAGVAVSMTVLGTALLRRRPTAGRTGGPGPALAEVVVLTGLTVALGMTGAALVVASG